MIRKTIIFAFILKSYLCEGFPIFSEDAEKYMNVDFKTTIRRGVEIKDFTKLEVNAQPLDMIKSEDSLTTHNLKVEVKEGKGEWQRVETQPHIRAGVFKWTISDLNPCTEKEVKLSIHTDSADEESFIYPNIVKAPSMDEIALSGYRPKKPKSLTIIEEPQGNLKISWMPSECISSYDVTYLSVSTGESLTKEIEVSEEPSAIFSEGIASCSEYEIKVTSVIGDKYSQESVITYVTKPLPTDAKRIDPKVTSSTDSVTVSWNGFAQLSCFTKYTVAVCEHDQECPAGEKVERDDSKQLIVYNSRVKLEECSKYRMVIQPLYDEANIEPKVIDFKTKSHQIGDMVLTGLQVSLSKDNEVILSWDDQKCANEYEIFHKVDNGQWEVLDRITDNHFKHEAESCTENMYGIRVVDESLEREIQEFEGFIKLAPLMSVPNHPSIIVEERGNGSVIFALNGGEKNKMCSIEKFHVIYDGTEEFIEAATLTNNKIMLNNLKTYDNIKARLKYDGFDVWTNWAFLDSVVTSKQTDGYLQIVVPAVISFVIFIIIIIVVILIVRFRKSKEKYDEEKAKGVTEESKKLNKQMEDMLKK